MDRTVDVINIMNKLIQTKSRREGLNLILKKFFSLLKINRNIVDSDPVTDTIPSIFYLQKTYLRLSENLDLFSPRE